MLHHTCHRNCIAAIFFVSVMIINTPLHKNGHKINVGILFSSLHCTIASYRVTIMIGAEQGTIILHNVQCIIILDIYTCAKHQMDEKQ